MNCRNCNAYNSDTAEYCALCGAPLKDSGTSNQTSSASSTKKTVIIICVIALVLILTVVAVFLLKNMTDKNSTELNDSISTSIQSSPVNNVLSISLAEHSKTLGIGDSDIIKAICNPSDSYVIWSSSDTTIVKVDNDGVITGISAGSAVITASAGNLSDTCTVTVKAPSVTQVIVKTTQIYIPTPPVINDPDYWLDSLSINSDLGGESYLYGKSYDDVQKMINEILARHGYIFKKHNANTVCFENQPWYTPLYSDMNYVESLFNSYERENYQFLAAYRNKYF